MRRRRTELLTIGHVLEEEASSLAKALAGSKGCRDHERALDCISGLHAGRHAIPRQFDILVDTLVLEGRLSLYCPDIGDVQYCRGHGLGTRV